MITRLYFFLVCILFSTSAFGQDALLVEQLTLDSFLQIVRNNHPVMRQAILLEAQAEASQLKSRGGFDPKLFGDFESKSFDEKNYFRKAEGGVKIPTWIGADLKLAYTWSDGIFLNDENNLPANGQAVVGVEVPLAQGLFFDKRRAQVQLADLLGDRNEAERNLIINNLLMEASEAYWKWAYSARSYEIYKKALDLAENRFQLIKTSFEQGDKPAIDTLESLIQVQSRQISLREAETKLINAKMYASTYLWSKELSPMQINSISRPDRLEQTNVELAQRNNRINVLFENINRHPKLEQIQVKSRELKLKERLKRENLKPSISLNYNLLADGFDFNGGGSGPSENLNLFQENYKWGIDMSYSLFLRKERGDLQKVRLDQIDNDYKLQDQRIEIENKAQMVLQELLMTENQVGVQANILNNYQRLLEAENEKFRIGESSIFLLNSREQKLIENELKLAKLQADYQKLILKLDWASGQFL